jgi:endonuclease YncB( thermonuclease family)
MNKIVQLKNTSSEKYGRLLADVYLDDVCINTWMIEQGFAVAYSGGTKVRPDEWM